VKLLVSVRSAEEAAVALAGGASIVDAKEPEAGALGAVAPVVLTEIRQVVPVRVPLSAALGDVATPEEIERIFGAIDVPLAFVKVGFLGVDDPSRVQSLLAMAVRRAELLAARPGVVAVAYADWRRAGGPPPHSFPALLRDTGAHGLLVDTALKTVGTLRDFLPAGELLALGGALRLHGLGYALAGSLALSDVPLIQGAGADILGVRGAVCDGGRNGRVQLELVRALAAEVAGERDGASRDRGTGSREGGSPRRS
jgi:(5-formylfuran-3-yl)methyl phosphate synthase